VAIKPARIGAEGSTIIAWVDTELRTNGFHSLRNVRRMTVLAPPMLTQFRPNADASLTTPRGPSATLIPP
jgi:hypothetical protein